MSKLVIASAIVIIIVFISLIGVGSINYCGNNNTGISSKEWCDRYCNITFDGYEIVDTWLSSALTSGGNIEETYCYYLINDRNENAYWKCRITYNKNLDNNNLFKNNIWIYGYSVNLTEYLIDRGETWAQKTMQNEN